MLSQQTYKVMLFWWNYYAPLFSSLNLFHIVAKEAEMQVNKVRNTKKQLRMIEEEDGQGLVNL